MTTNKQSMRPNKYKKGPKSIETGQVVGVFEPPQTEIPANIQDLAPIARRCRGLIILAQNEVDYRNKAKSIDRGEVDGFFQAEI